jgi:hypothetical protein
MLPNTNLRLDREGYDRCWQMLRKAGIEFVEEGRETSYLGPNRVEEIEIEGTLQSARHSMHCWLRLCGRHYKLRLLAQPVAVRWAWADNWAA